MKDVWKDVVDYEGLYKVSNLGRVWSVRKNIILYKRLRTDGYLTVRLSGDFNKKDIAIHRLVAMAFAENTHNKPCVNHVDGNKLNNKATNLEWVTVEENNIHALNMGLIKYKYKKVIQRSKNGEIIKFYQSIKEAGKENKVYDSNISKACAGILKTTGGYIWEYAE